jgi:threonine dehydrogenase-like Zn-dependent dehydrogenase
VCLARRLGHVIGIDIESYRLATANPTANAEVINSAESDPVEAIRGLTEGRRAKVYVDAVAQRAVEVPIHEAEQALRPERSLADCVAFMSVIQPCEQPRRRLRNV